MPDYDQAKYAKPIACWMAAGKEEKRKVKYAPNGCKDQACFEEAILVQKSVKNYSTPGDFFCIQNEVAEHDDKAIEEDAGNIICLWPVRIGKEISQISSKSSKKDRSQKCD